jgi:hypothetical protein
LILAGYLEDSSQSPVKPLRGLVRVGACLPGCANATPGFGVECLRHWERCKPDATSQSLDGYDPAEKCWKSVGFDSEAAFTESYVKIENMNTVKQLSSGAKGTYEMRLTKEDGSVVTAGGRWLWSTFDGSKGTLELTGRVEDGQQQPDMTYTLERKKRKADS